VCAHLCDYVVCARFVRQLLQYGATLLTGLILVSHKILQRCKCSIDLGIVRADEIAEPPGAPYSSRPSLYGQHAQSASRSETKLTLEEVRPAVDLPPLVHAAGLDNFSGRIVAPALP